MRALGILSATLAGLLFFAAYLIQRWQVRVYLIQESSAECPTRSANPDEDGKEAAKNRTEALAGPSR
jgi:hypothetical protein